MSRFRKLFGLPDKKKTEYSDFKPRNIEPEEVTKKRLSDLMVKDENKTKMDLNEYMRLMKGRRNK